MVQLHVVKFVRSIPNRVMLYSIQRYVVKFVSTVPVLECNDILDTTLCCKVCEVDSRTAVIVFSTQLYVVKFVSTIPAVQTWFTW